ncbi:MULTISPECIES: TetR/AcrR family transcriptional regulator [unclassified Brevundimonas]|uniref:TetR/AcrR family transcriptional regulator n=1 Tax=unclassified Brevundimonas TaxID=2622653 RepID=UPI0025C19A3B|nr:MULTISPECIES: TetR/AcrR family transcriptional regulator [unclassified Brevundimonas]
MKSDDDLAPALPPVTAAPARRGRPKKTKTAAAGETRDAILNAAEDLFSKHGFYGVTIREVAREAGVDTALVHYYFGAKKELFDAVFIRRAEVWNNERVAAVDRYAEAAGEAMTLEGLFEAFLRPPFQWSLKGGPGWKHYAALVAQTNANPAFGGETMARYFDPAIRRLLELVKRIHPEARDEDLYWAWHNLSGALTLTLGETGRLDRLSGGLCKSGDLDSACDYMVRFAAAGFRAVCGSKTSG